MHLKERERRWGDVGWRWWSVAEDGDGGGVFGTWCWCRWLVGVQSMFV
ncbi:hypothetical protein HanXRQr2_Chr02g0066651 [Helianthus annuus]|uniref:Uncharacterized protein n=1 Tax=Helianthus annuus TaxID=4232 RepID=A0A9K3JNV8_HELAN|nr:hypothetical protein HanXRQr2_Chr02g0066651 [Helianthus annuus]KAJ0604815.1 hypothetical protein HanHA300_Chr02g0054561 [Helianthus annuus]KAJ0618831.1 hypothetical protein HanHA89_Chr02g0058041 [Helianthus annuus]